MVSRQLELIPSCEVVVDVLVSLPLIAVVCPGAPLSPVVSARPFVWPAAVGGRVGKVGVGGSGVWASGIRGIALCSEAAWPRLAAAYTIESVGENKPVLSKVYNSLETYGCN